MAFIQSEYALGQKTAPQAFSAGAVVAYTATVSIPTGETLGAGDTVELAALPANHRIVDATVIADGDFDGKTAAIGIMSGNFGADDATRTSGTELFAAAALTGFTRLATGTAAMLPTSDKDRSIGVKLSGTVTGAGQTLTLLLLLAQ